MEGHEDEDFDQQGQVEYIVGAGDGDAVADSDWTSRVHVVSM